MYTEPMAAEMAVEQPVAVPETASAEQAAPETVPEAVQETALPEAGYAVPDDETLLSLCEDLRGRYPRMNGEHMIASDAFRAFGERMAWDTRAIAAGLPGLIEDAQALLQAAQPPVSRATGTAASTRRPLLSPHQQRELAEWNRANPQYKMSELDYFSALKNG